MFKEIVFSSIVAVMGTIISTYLGGWDALLKALVFFMVLDYLTGVLGAFKDHTVSSDVMFWGGVRKVVIIVVIALAVVADEIVGNEGYIFRTLAIYFYLAREGLSITENLGTIGVPLPEFFKKFLTQLQEKGGGNNDTNK